MALATAHPAVRRTASPRRELALGLCVAAALLLFAAPACAGDIDTQIKDQKIFDAKVFPSERPPLHDFRTFADLTSSSWSCSELPGTGGALRITVNHPAVPNITADMVSWLFQTGLRKSTTWTDGKKYSNFVLMHPRDHAQHDAIDPKTKAVLTDIKRGSETHWLEMPLTGCTEAAGDAAAPYTCPRGAATPNPGYLSSVNTTAWTTREQVNGTSNVATAPKVPQKYLADPVNTKSRASGKVEFWVKGCSLNPKNKTECYNKIITTRHSWTSKGAPAGSLLITTVQTIGIPFGVARAVDANTNRIVPNWANGQDRMMKCKRAVLHFAEEYGALQYWLPRAFDQRNN